MKLRTTYRSYNNWSILVTTEWKYAILIDHITTDRLSAKLIKIWDSFSWLITDNWSIWPIDDMLADRFYVSGRKLAQYNNILIDR